METREKILNASRYTGYIILLTGLAVFLYGFFVSEHNVITSVGIGTVMGAIFIFLIGVFFAATEEMLANTSKGTKIAAIKPRLTVIHTRKGAPM